MSIPVTSIAAPTLRVLMSVSAVSFGEGIMVIALPLAFVRSGLDASSIGLILTANSCGFILGCILFPHVAARMGHLRAAAFYVGTIVLGASVIALTAPSSLWIPLRGLAGFSIAGLYVAFESWIIGQSGVKAQGHLATYAMLRKLGFVGGQLVATNFADGESKIFLIATIASAAAIMPLLERSPVHSAVPRLGSVPSLAIIRRCFRGVSGAFLAGTTAGPVVALLPHWGVAMNYGNERAAFLAVAFHVGGIFLQAPGAALMRRLSSHAGPSTAAAAICAVAAVIAFSPATGCFPLVVILVLIFGGFNSILYNASLIGATSTVKREFIPLVASNILVLWAGGAAAGGLVGGLALEEFGPAGLFVYIASLSGMFIVIMRIAKWSDRSPTPGRL